MQPHQECVVAEHKELVEKLSKLNAFLASDKLTSVPDDEQNRLREQAICMQDYANVLARRIEAF